MIVKLLGGLDLLAAMVFLILTFGIPVFMPIVIFSAVLLLFKGLFIFGGDALSAVDLVSAGLLILSIPFSLPVFLLWIPSFLLIAKGFVSFI